MLYLRSLMLIAREVAIWYNLCVVILVMSLLSCNDRDVVHVSTTSIYLHGNKIVLQRHADGPVVLYPAEIRVYVNNDHANDKWYIKVGDKEFQIGRTGAYYLGNDFNLHVIGSHLITTDEVVGLLSKVDGSNGSALE